MNGTGVDPFVVETESIDNLTVVVQVSHTLSPIVVHVTSCDSMPVSCPIPIPSHDTISYHCHSSFPCHLFSSHTHPPPPHRCVHQEMDLQSVEEEDVKSVLGVDRGVTPYFSLFCSHHHHQNHNICDSFGINHSFNLNLHYMSSKFNNWYANFNRAHCF